MKKYKVLRWWPRLCNGDISIIVGVYTDDNAMEEAIKFVQEKYKSLRYDVSRNAFCADEFVINDRIPDLQEEVLNL